MIVVLNTVLKIINVTFINAIGFAMNSEIIAYMVTGVFIAQFVNTGLMTLVAYADFSMTPLSFVPVNNLYAEFSRDWYLDVGKQIVMTMGILSMMPYVAFTTAWAASYAKRWLDKRKLRPGSVTSKSTIQNYVMLYSGPDVLL